MSITTLIVMVIHLFSLASLGGLVFAMWLAPKAESSERWLAGFCGVLWLWAGMSLIQVTQVTAISPIIFRLYSSAWILSFAIYFVFVVDWTHAQGRVVQVASATLILLGIAIGLLIWLGDTRNLASATAGTSLTTTEFTIVGVAVIYLIVTIWILLDTGTEQATWLRLPTIALIIGYFLSLFDAPRQSGVDILLQTIVAIAIGRKLIQQRLLQPLIELHAELRVANRDLQNAVNELSYEKAQITSLTQQLEQSNRFKDQFLATMSHELRTPLNSILGYSELLLKNVYGELQDQQHDRLERVYQNGMHLSGLINAILDLNKIDSGKMRLDVNRFQLVDIIRSLEEDVRALCKEKELDYSIDFTDSMPVVMGDKKRLTQVFDILIKNAIKFTHDGYVRVHATNLQVVDGICKTFQLPTSGWLKDGDWVLAWVKDSGIGIAPENQSEIFDQFSQVDGSRTREHEGIGLGLTIAKRLIEMHDGVIWVQSRLDEGSTFYVALPVALEAEIVQSA